MIFHIELLDFCLKVVNIFTVSVEDLALSIWYHRLRVFIPVEINKENLTDCGLECQIMGLETYFEANIVDSKLEIGILF